jgi:UDP-3-O-[3-hydroxymyristoyl] glucosamine N-acyltransferase
MPKKNLKEIADYVKGKVIGDDSIEIETAATLDSAGPGQITFLNNPKYAPQVKTTQAAAILVARQV